SVASTRCQRNADSTMRKRVNASAAATNAVLPASRWGSTSPRRILRDSPKAMTTVATKRAATAARWRLNTARKLLALPNFLRVLARAVLVVLVGFVAVGCSSDD